MHHDFLITAEMKIRLEEEFMYSVSETQKAKV